MTPRSPPWSNRLKTVKAPGRNPVFQVLFAFHDSAVPLLDFAGLKGHLLERHNQTAKMDMNVICIPRAEQHVTLGETNLAEEELTVMWEYNSDLFERETIQRFVEEYVTLLKNILSSTDQRISELDLVPAGEKQTLARASHGRRVEYLREQTLVELFEERVRCRADEIAIVHNDKTLTFAALNARANRLAHRLRQMHRELSHSPFKPGTPVGLCVERDFDMVTGMFGILKAGGCLCSALRRLSRTTLALHAGRHRHPHHSEPDPNPGSPALAGTRWTHRRLSGPGGRLLPRRPRIPFASIRPRTPLTSSIPPVRPALQRGSAFRTRPSIISS